jgi:CO dehydrogenase maturation factor
MALKIAISGKGGVGKTTLAGILARLLGREGKEVLVLDADPASTLAGAVGVSPEVASGITPLSSMLDMIEDRTGVRPGAGYGGMFKLNPRVDDLADRFAIEGKDGVRLLVLGTIKQGGSGCFCPESALLKSLLKHLILERDQYLIMDMEAGLEHLGRASSRNMDVMIVVVEPGMRSVDIALRIRNMAKEIGIPKVVAVINKAFDTDGAEIVRKQMEEQGVPVVAIIPYSMAMVEADLRGISPMDVEGGEEVVQAVDRIREHLENESI